MTIQHSSVLHRFFSTFPSLRNLLMLLPLFIVAGCGDVEWLPEYEKDQTAPASFTLESKEGVEPGMPVTSEPIIISGISAGSAPISISGGSSSKYSIDGKTATDVNGTVSNGDEVTVTHTASKDLGETTTSTLTIGKVRETFSSTTRTVTLSWQTSTDEGTVRQAIATVIAKDNVSGGHVISIKDSLNSSKPVFAVTEANSSPDFRSAELTISILNNKKIYVRNSEDTKATTTLTIDGKDFPVPLAK